jgi:hypothetical protein
MIWPHCRETATLVSEQEKVLSIGDTTFLDYDKIVAKREGYGPIGKGGNGLILHSALAVNPDDGQPQGLLWQKLWHREPLVPSPAQETPEQKNTEKPKRNDKRDNARLRRKNPTDGLKPLRL